MKRVIFSILLLSISVLCQRAHAKQISITLNASDSLIRSYSWTVLFYLKYDDGEEHSGELFSLDDLKAGTKSKPYFIDETKKITDCIYTWAIMENPPGHADPTVPLVLPEGFNGMLKNTCKVNPADNELKLTFGDFQLKSLRITVATDAFDKHSAKAVVYRVQPESVKDKYKFSQKVVRESDLPHETIKNVLFRDKTKFTVSNTWVLKGGGTEAPQPVVTDQFDIKIE